MEETEIISVSETGFESQLSAGKNEIADENGKPDNPDEESLTVKAPSDDGDNAPLAEDVQKESDARIEALVAEAEQRGYLRGRNEKISALMQEPGMLERSDSMGIDSGYAENVPILRREKVSIWDL